MDDYHLFGIELDAKQRNLLKKVDKACREIRSSEEKSYLEEVFNDKRRVIFGKHNLLGIPLEKKYGGLGFDLLTYLLCLERIGEEGSSLRTFFSVHNSIGSMVIQEWGNMYQKKKYLPLAASGKALFGFGLTEPQGGSDPANMRTVYKKKDGHYIIKGVKKWIGHADVGKVFVTFARDKDDISAFIVDKGEGLYSRKITGLSGMRNHDVGELHFSNLRVPKENLLGQKGKGLHIAFKTLMHGRLSVAAGCLGVMKDCLREASEYAKKRVVHGKKIGKHQLIQEHLAHISTNLHAGRGMVYSAAKATIEFEMKKSLKLREKADMMISQAKYFCSNASFDAANRAVQVLGGVGLLLTAKAARHLADDRITRIYEGTDEIQILKIARYILGKGYDAFQ